MSVALNLNGTYNFNTYFPSILGLNYQNMKVIGIMSSTEAIKYGDIQTLHTTLQGVTPPPTVLPLSVASCNWILFQNSSGVTSILAYEYLDPNSIVLVTTNNIRIELANTNTSDLSILRNRLLELGYTNITITTF